MRATSKASALVQPAATHAEGLVGIPVRPMVITTEDTAAPSTSLVQRLWNKESVFFQRALFEGWHVYGSMSISKKQVNSIYFCIYKVYK